MRKISSFVMAAVVAVPLVTGAQTSKRPLAAGDTIRWSRTDGRFRGVITKFDRDGFVLQRVGRVDTVISTSVPIPRLERLEGRTSRLANLGRGALAGFAVGAVAGAIMGAVSYEPGSWFFGTPGSAAAMGAAVFGVLLTPVGAGIGLLMPTERWRDVPCDNLARSSVMPRLRIIPFGGGLGVEVSLTPGRP